MKKVEEGDEEADDEEEAEDGAEEREAGEVEAVVRFAVDEDHFGGAADALQEERGLAGPGRDLTGAVEEVFGMAEEVEAERGEGEEGREGENPKSQTPNSKRRI